MKEQGFDLDLVLQPRRSERIAWRVAAATTGLSVLLGAAIIVMMPLKHTEVFTVLVDKATGQAERLIQVKPTGIDDEKAMKESLLVSYVTDRESYIVAGIQQRLESVQRRSSGAAETSLRRLWTDNSDNPNYPPTVYGAGAEVTVVVKAINFLNPDVAQVRFEKTLRRKNDKPVTRKFIATIGFEFKPEKVRALSLVWENPLGFKVTTYQVDTETLGG